MKEGDYMKFEQGKTYKVYNKGAVKVVKRTRCYITIAGLVSGRFMICQDGLFRGSEYVLLPACHGLKWFCVADDQEKI